MFIQTITFILKLFFYSITFQFIYTDMAGQSHVSHDFTLQKQEKSGARVLQAQQIFLNNSNLNETETFN